MKKGKEIYFGLLLIIVFLISTMYFSYAFFTSKNEEHGKLNIVAGTLDYKIESSDLENNQITVAANTMKKITIDITSLNDISSKYELYYTANNSEGLTIGYGDNNNEASGIIDAKSNKKVEVYIRNTSSSSKIITFNAIGSLLNDNIKLNSNSNILVNLCIENSTYVFDYVGSSENFIVPCTGNYKVELWGASGVDFDGGTLNQGVSLAAYTSGKINLPNNNELFTYVGGKGGYPSIDDYTVGLGGYNGGGAGGLSAFSDTSSWWPGAGGGGATDIRLVSGNWDDFESLKSRIIVAAGSGGQTTSDNSGAGGGLIGYDSSKGLALGATQTSVFFGKGQTPITKEVSASWGAEGNSGGGGGYYGGNVYNGSGTQSDASGAGGSSFISGHNGCDAITEDSTEDNITHTGQSIHHSGYSFTDTVMIDGLGYQWTTEKGDTVVGMPTHDGTSTMIGNSGNGYAKITYLGN